MRILICILVYCCCLVPALQAQNRNLSEGVIFDGEPYLAINPANPSNIVVAWMGFVFQNGTGLTIKVRSSFDGGKTWGNTVTMPHIVPTYKSADPTMVFDAQGNLFLAYIDHRESPDSGGVYLFKSTDGGLAWGAPVKVIDIYADGDRLPIDRPWLTGNLAGDKLYITTKPAPWVLPPNRAYFMASADSGVTWSPWRYIDSSGYLIGNLIAQPMAAPASHDNWFGAIYPSFVFQQNFQPQYILATSINPMAGFSYHSVYAGNNIAANDSAKLGYRFLVNPADPNHYCFLFFLSPFGDIDLMMTESPDAGITWTLPIRVNDDAPGNGRMQDLVWADFDEDGDLLVTWRDRRHGAGPGYGVGSEIYAAFRHRDSTDFSPNFRVSDSLTAYQDILAENGNDFMGMEVLNDTMYAAWGSVQDGSLNIWFMKMAASTGTVSGTCLLASEQQNIILRQGSSPGLFSIGLRDNSPLQGIEIFSISGELVYRARFNSSVVEIDLRKQPAGVYILTGESQGIVFRTKIFR